MTWGHALTHPADNVVAATIVLIGVMLTALITLIVSGLNRRHERNKEDRERLFGPRAETYLAVREWLQADQDWAQAPDEDPATRSRSEKSRRTMAKLASRLSIYGTPDASRTFDAAVRANTEHKRRQHTIRSPRPQVVDEAIVHTMGRFDDQVRKDIRELKSK